VLAATGNFDDLHVGKAVDESWLVALSDRRAGTTRLILGPCGLHLSLHDADAELAMQVAAHHVEHLLLCDES
jgi:hypothetical protein